MAQEKPEALPDTITSQSGGSTGALVTSTAIIATSGLDDDRHNNLQNYINRLMKIDKLFDEVEELLRQRFSSELIRVYRILSSSGSSKIDTRDLTTEEPQPNPDDIKKAFQKIAMVTHPDRNMGKSDDEVRKLEELFKTAKEAYKSGNAFIVIQILSQLEGKTISLEDLKKEFQDLFQKVVLERTFFGIKYIDAYMGIAQMAQDNEALITADRISEGMEGKVEQLLQEFLSRQSQ